MKILFFGGGLGNQIFEYYFYQYLKNKYPNEKIYGVYSKLKLSEHNGLEIHKWFKVTLPISRFYANWITYLLFFNKRIFGNTNRLDLNTRICKNENAIVFHSFKYTKAYITKIDKPKWNDIEGKLSLRNQNVLKSIRESSSVFLHVRRGDYLSDKYRKYYEGTCPISYYLMSIKDIQNKVSNAKFFVFSDDIAWTKKNLPLQDACFVDWNIGKNSPIDMFLMSQCKNGIIANSTFSYWGALLGIKKQYVYYPQKWINDSQGTPDLFFEDWISF